MIHTLRVLCLAVAANALCFAADQAASAQAERRITDATGRTIAVPARIERVYAAGPPASVLVFALAPDKLIGWTRAMRPDEAAFLPQRYAALPELGRLTGRGNSANVEVVLRGNPDVIVDAGSTAPTFVSLAERVQAQTGIPYLLFDGRFDATADTLRRLGALLGDEASARALADYVERSLADVKRRVAAVPAARQPRVYYARGPNGLQTAAGGSINIEVLDFIGARNVAGDSSGGLINTSLEQVLAWNPEVIITTDPNFYAAVWKDARWSSVAAVRAKRVHLAPHLPFGWFDFPPGANRIIGLYWIARILYPAEFPEDLRARVTEFYRLFYHQEPAAARIDQLLGEPGVMPK